MRRQRIGTDLMMRIAVTRIGGGAEDFGGAEAMSVVVWHAYRRWLREENFTIDGNAVSLQLSAAEQELTGPYGVTVRWAKSDAGSETGVRHYAVDIPRAFELVGPGADCCADDGDAVSLGGHVMLCRDGRDGSTPYVGDNGNWWVGGEDTGKPSQGKDGEPGTFAYPVFEVDPKTGFLTVREPFFMDDEIKLDNGYLKMSI